jgi:hypothetical protein
MKYFNLIICVLFMVLATIIAKNNAKGAAPAVTVFCSYAIINFIEYKFQNLKK